MYVIEMPCHFEMSSVRGEPLYAEIMWSCVHALSFLNVIIYNLLSQPIVAFAHGYFSRKF